MDDDLKNNIFAGDEKIGEVTNKIIKEGRKNNILNYQSGLSNSQETLDTGVPSAPTQADKDEINEIASGKPPINPIRTYSDDIAKTIKDGQTSVLSINLAEKKKLEVRQDLADVQGQEIIGSEESRKNLLITIISIILIVAGLGTLITFYFINKNSNNQTPVVTTPIGVNKHVAINVSALDANNIESEVAKTKSQQFEKDSVTYLDLTLNQLAGSKIFGISEFLPIFSKQIPGSLLRAFDDKFALGLYTSDTNNLFLIINVNSYDNAFAGMLEWEKYMPNDLLPFFAANQSLSGDPLKNKNFLDTVINNKDVRVLKDNDRNPLLLYSFLDAKTLLIASDENTFKELVKRYDTSKLER